MANDPKMDALKNRIRQLEWDALEYQRIEDELRASQKRFQALIDTLPHGIVETDATGVITFSNRAMHTMCGFAENDLVGRRALDLVTGLAEKKNLTERIKTVTQSRRPAKPLFTRIGTGDQRLIDVEVAWDYKRTANDTITGYIAVVTDITERLSADRAVKESELRYRSLFEKAGDAIFLIEAEGPNAGKIIDANQAAAAMHGYTVEELKTMSIKQIDGPQAARHVPNRLDRILKGEWIYEEIEHRRRDGSLFPVGLSAGLIMLGEKKAVLGIDRDITESKETEKRLRQSEMRYRAIFEGSGEGILLVDGRSMRIHYANPAMCAFLGYELTQLTQMSVTDLHPRAALDTVLSELHTLARGGGAALIQQTPCLRGDGGIMYADIRTGPIELDGKPFVAAFFADVTEQVGVKAALRDQVVFLQTLIDTLPHPIYYKDTQGRYLGCNQAFERFIGKNRQQVIGKTVHDIEIGEQANEIAKADQRLFTSQKAQTYEARIRLADGIDRSIVFNKAVFYRKNGEIGGLVGGIIDVSDLKRVEKEKDLLATAIEQSPEIVIITDLKDRIHYVNPAFERITGYSRREVVGRTPALLNSGRQTPAFYKTMRQTLLSGASWKGRMINRRKNGSHFEVEAVIVPVQRKDGLVTDYLSVERDITHEIMQEKHLRQAQKIEAIGTLAGGIAHDFNNILSAIIGFTEIALHDIPADSPTRTFLSKVLTAGDRARGLVNQILAFSRSTEQEVRPVEVRFIVKEALKLLEATLPSTIKIVTRIESSDTIMADPTQIHQVVMNLCTNAAHAMKQNGGVLTVCLKGQRRDEALTRQHPHLSGDNFLRLSVSDTGHGIEPDILERIFDPFFTTKKQGEGTGMGLSVVHGIIKGFGGLIHVQSIPGKGSCFDIFLPAIDTTEPPMLTARKPLHMGNETILFVDDEPFQVELGKQMLKRLGYTVHAVRDSLEALDRFTAAPRTFDLVITDMTMPSMTGDELARRIMAIRPNIPVIICTGYSEKLNKTDAARQGFAGVVYKPLIMKELAQLIRQALDDAKTKRQGADLKTHAPH